MTTRPTVRRSFAPRGVIGGAVLLAVGVAFLLAAIGFPQAEGGRYLFLALGLAFAAAYALGTRQFVYLLPAGVLTGFGVGLLIPAWFGLSSSLANAAFLGALALGLVAVFALAPERWAPLALAAVLAVIAVASLFLRIDLVPTMLQPFFVPLIVIAVGAYLLIVPAPERR